MGMIKQLKNLSPKGFVFFVVLVIQQFVFDKTSKLFDQIKVW